MKVHYFNDFGINVMKDSSKLDKITFLERLEKKCYQILWPSEIRNKLYSNLLENRAA